MEYRPNHLIRKTRRLLRQRPKRTGLDLLHQQKVQIEVLSTQVKVLQGEVAQLRVLSNQVTQLQGQVEQLTQQLQGVKQGTVPVQFPIQAVEMDPLNRQGAAGPAKQVEPLLFPTQVEPSLVDPVDREIVEAAMTLCNPLMVELENVLALSSITIKILSFRINLI